MRPFETASATFRNDQTPFWDISFWDTTCSVPQAGLEISLFDILDTSFDLLVSSYATKATLDAALNNSTSSKKFRSVLGYDQTGARHGLEPNLYKYWGPGAPAGCKNARRVFLKYKGKVVADDTATHPVTLVFGGQGKVRVFKNGTSVASGVVKEPQANAVPKDAATIASQAGYLVVETTLTRNDVLEIYYANNGEAWGGIMGKVIPGIGHTSNWSTFRAKLRDAGVIGAGFLTSSTPTETSLPYCTSALLQAGEKQIPVLQIEAVIAPFGNIDGFRLENVGGMNQLIDNADATLIVRPGRLVQFKAGFDAGVFGEEVYPRFTGRITSISPNRGGETVTITCHGIEQFLETCFDENNPDILSYIANGFIDREWAGYPVFGIAAFDAWPMEAVLADLCARAGIDAASLGKSPFDAAPSFGKYTFRKAVTGTLYYGQPRFYARSLSDSTELVTLQRNNNYGNVGALKKTYLPNDDPYIHPAKVSDRLFDHAAEIAEQFGYDFFFDAAGQATIGSRNNPQSWQFFSANGDSTQSINPSAIGGRFYRNLCGTGAPSWTKQFTANCSRVDLYCGIGYETDTNGNATLNGGMFQVTVEVNDGTSWVSLPSATKTFSTYQASVKQSFYYDDIIAQDGSNATVFTLFTLPFDNYRVTISPIGPSLSDPNAQAVIALNGVAVFERDPSTSPYETPLSTVGNILEFNPSSNEKDLRNHIIVVGQRKADVTDSAKFSEDNPNNPFTEFYVSVAADPYSIYDPAAPNFVGGKRMVVVVDDKVTDSDFAKWLARTALYRFNMPKLEANITHTAIPQLEVRDPIRVVDEKDDSIQHTLWVQRFQERWTTEDCEVDIELTSYPELPSYTPREDIDIEALFQSSPAYNVSASYKNIYGFTVKNLAMPSTMPTITKSSLSITNSVSITIPGSGYGDNAFLSRGAVSSITNPDKDILVNHPYRRFWNVASNGRTLNFDFQEGDGTAGVYDQGFYGFPSGWQVNHEAFATRTGGKTANPFYDPYTSESGIGNLVSVKFDSLVSGFYRVSLWAVNQNGTYDFPVAYLTHPEGNPEDEDAHWTYMEAGSGREFLWDGTDSVGLWNRYQSRDFARVMEGSFDDKAMAVGKGFYVWNDAATDELTQIGDNVAENMGPDGRPFFTRGRYSRFYIKIEAHSDKLARKGSGNKIYSVNSHNDLKAIPSAFYVFTHLGEPTQVKLSMEEWDPNASLWVESTTANNWLAVTSATAASIANGRPVRISFAPVPRRGLLFYNESGIQDDEKVSAQLFRTVHMKVNVFDQFWTFTGKPWDGDINEKNKSSQNSNNRESKRLTSRMHTDDDHTVEFSSQDWLSGKDLKATKWIFQPDMFKKDFGDGVEEAIRYGDYEQLYSLPGYDIQQGGATSRIDKAFINLAFLNYLFYLSAHTLDRSGRRQYCLNTSFIDKSKIVTPAWRAATVTANPEYCVSYPRFGADMLLVKTIFTRQWIEPTWKTANPTFLALSPVDTNHPITHGISDSFQLKWVQPSVLDFNPLTTPMNNASNSAQLDKWTQAYMTDTSQVNIDFWNRFGTVRNQKPKTLPTHSPYYALTGFGSWNFSRYIYSGWFQPSPCRDFMPYWREPGMPDWAANSTANCLDHQWTNSLYGEPGVNILEAPVSFFGSIVRDIPAQANWFGYAFSDTYNYTDMTYRGARLEEDVLAWARDNEKGAEMGVVFDYVRQDSLNRFDMFRGVVSRSPMARRQDLSDNASDDASYWHPDAARQAGSAPVKPSGQYLLNLGNYHDYIMAPATAIQAEDALSSIHMTQDVENFFDIRFRYEYVWYSSRFFPVYPASPTLGGGGGAMYWAFRNLTGLPTSAIEYDAGAWTGHKDDLTPSQWTADGHLRWMELFGTDIGAKGEKIIRNGTSSRPHVGGGYPDFQGLTPPSTGRASQPTVVMGATPYVQRVNFYAEPHANHRQRLAVGPRVPETKTLVMNLSLPATFYK